MGFFRYFEDWFSRLEETFIGGAIIFASLLLFVNVIMRYVFRHAIFWAEELVRYLMVWLIFVGASQVVKKEGHISVDLVHKMLPSKYETILKGAVDLIALLFCMALTYYGFEQVTRIWRFQQVSAALEMPMWIAYLSIPLGSALMVCRYIHRLAKRVKDIRNEKSWKS